MESFWDWINSHYLNNLHLGGAKYTRSNHQSPPTLLRLDRFLVTSDWIDLYPEVCQIALPKPNSDHCPILLIYKTLKWGPSPFRLEPMWLEDKRFSALIKEWWNSHVVNGWAGFKLSSKLKQLKLTIKDWRKRNFEPVKTLKAKLLEELQSLYIREESQRLS